MGTRPGPRSWAGRATLAASVFGGLACGRTDVSILDGDATASDSTFGESATDSDDGGVEPLPALPPACAIRLHPDQPSVPIFDDESLLGGRLMVLDAGDRSSGRPLKLLALHSEHVGDAHPEYVARVYESPEWPELYPVGAPVALTRRGHAVSQLWPIDEGLRRWIYVWAGDPRGGENAYDRFASLLDLDVGAVVEERTLDIDQSKGANLFRIPGHPRFVLTTRTDDFGTTPNGMTSGDSMRELDMQGRVVAGPTPLTLRAPSPGPESVRFWAADRVGVAVSNNECDAASPLCAPYSVSIATSARVEGPGTAIENYAITHRVPALPDSAFVSPVSHTQLFGRHFVMWSEAPDSKDAGPGRTVRGFATDLRGDAIAWPADAGVGEASSIVADATVSSTPGVIVSPLGITVYTRDALEEPTGETRFFFVLEHFDFELQPLGEPIVLDVGTRPAQAPPGQTGVARPGQVHLDDGVLFGWNEWDGSDGQRMRFAKLECDPAAAGGR